jgi:hypothetical protein
MVKANKKKGAGKASQSADDDDWDAILEAEAQVNQTEQKVEKVEEAAVETKNEAPEKPPVMDAAAAFLAAQGLLDTEDGEEGGKNKKKKKKKKPAGAAEPKEEKVSLRCCRHNLSKSVV